MTAWVVFWMGVAGWAVHRKNGHLLAFALTFVALHVWAAWQDC